jgi:hypothetical protein
VNINLSHGNVVSWRMNMLPTKHCREIVKSLFSYCVSIPITNE